MSTITELKDRIIYLEEQKGICTAAIKSLDTVYSEVVWGTVSVSDAQKYLYINYVGKRTDSLKVNFDTIEEKSLDIQNKIEELEQKLNARIKSINGEINSCKKEIRELEAAEG